MGIFLKCDVPGCDVTYNGGNGLDLPGPYRLHGYHFSQAFQLEKDARSIGWTGALNRGSENDKCPKCSQQAAADLVTLSVIKYLETIKETKYIKDTTVTVHDEGDDSSILHFTITTTNLDVIAPLKESQQVD